MPQSKTQLLNPGNSPQIIATAVAGILSLFPDTAPIGVAGSIFVLSWQNEQVGRFKKRVETRLNEIEDHLNLNSVSSPEFIELFIQATEAAARTASEQKHQALANALVASIVEPTSKFSGKSTIFRIINQISEEELVALKALSGIEGDYAENNNTDRRVVLKEIKEQLGWIEEEDVLLVCQSLLQLGLTKDTSSSTKGNCWNTTALAKPVLQFIIRSADNRS